MANNLSTALILHQGFEEMEAVAPIDILRRAYIDVTTVCLSENMQVMGRSNIIIKADENLKFVKDKVFDAVILPGGPGTYSHLRTTPGLVQWLQEHDRQHKIIAAICAAPLALLDAGLLRDRTYTAHPSTANELKSIDSSAPVQIDGNLITSRGAGTATEFALAILKALKGEAAAQQVAKAICYG